jgi:hypothetical protein
MRFFEETLGFTRVIMHPLNSPPPPRKRHLHLCAVYLGEIGADTGVERDKERERVYYGHGLEELL